MVYYLYICLSYSYNHIGQCDPEVSCVPRPCPESKSSQLILIN